MSSHCTPLGAQSSVSTAHYSSCVFKYTCLNSSTGSCTLLSLSLPIPVRHTLLINLCPPAWEGSVGSGLRPYTEAEWLSDWQCLVWWKSSSSLRAGNYCLAETIYVQALTRAAGGEAPQRWLPLQPRSVSCRSLARAAGVQALPEPRAGNYPCLTKCLWEEFPQGPGKPLHTLSCAHTHVSICCWGPCKPLENLGSCWAAKMHIIVRSQVSRIHYFQKN